jgi:hypothetical protein
VEAAQIRRWPLGHGSRRKPKLTPCDYFPIVKNRVALRAEREQSLLRDWIRQGAVWPESFEAPRHWSYVPPRRPSPPKVSNSRWIQSPIDAFVLHRMDEQALVPAPPASPEKLVRRLYLDLIGLPPTPEEVRAFTADPSRARFEGLVDQLMQRPQFGERWARHWLDLARYADSHGFQRDDLRDIWAYRDWVIQAFNDDMPFDQFTIEQIAGDLLPSASQSQKVATGFHRCAPTNVEAGSLPEETRVEQVLDRVNTTGAVWLGTTMECCQCHDHKYDPFTMRDYYQLYAFFNSTEMEADRTNPNTPSSIQFRGPSMPLADPERDSRRAELEKQRESLKEQQNRRRKKLASDLEDWVAELADELSDVAETHVLEISQFESQGTTDTHARLDDGSILLVGGDPPSTDVYTAHVRTNLAGIRGFRLDVLQDESLPGGGPGRGDPQRRNFVLNTFTAEVKSTKRPLAFRSATASFSQNKWDVSGAIDDDLKSGWAVSPKFDQSHWATFVLAEALTLADDAELVFKLVQNFGQARTIGRLRLSAITGNIDANAVEDEIVKAAQSPPAEWTPKQRELLLAHRIERDPQTQSLVRKLATLDKQIQALVPDTTLIMVELPAPRTSTIFIRGDYQQLGEAVEPDVPSALQVVGTDSSSEDALNRLDLARWLVARDNPLVARVTVNRWWAELFGQGIVTTPEDFGIKGEAPTHPLLLDWLAVEFMDNGWSMKHLLKTIVMSSTYQQSSAVTAEMLEQDPQNRWLARGPRSRMDAEMIRDNALAISGLLSLKPGGPPIRPYQPKGIWTKVGGQAYDYETSPGAEQYRRGIYVVLKRGSPYPSFVNFDATSRLACTVKRSRTNTPLQALTLLNDPVYVACAQSLAERVMAEMPGSRLDLQLEYAFQLCTARTPTAGEVATLRQLFDDQLAASLASASQQEVTETAARTAAWTSVASVLLNLHETITKD